MRLLYRLLIAGPMAAVFLGIAAAVFFPGFFLGGMMTDSCSGSPDKMSWWLSIVWPNVLVSSALIPPLLVLVKARWVWVLLSIAVGLAVSVVCYLLWLPLLWIVC
jgi:hypothetical protein